MGNYKFRFSDMIPNAWFYKLRDMTMNRSRRTTPTLHHDHNTNISQIQSFSNPGKSLYFPRDNLGVSQPKHTRATTVDYGTHHDYDASSDRLSFSSDNLGSNDIVFDVSGDLPLLELHPIITTNPAAKNAKKEQRRRPDARKNLNSVNPTAIKPRKSSVSSSGVKLRVNSPKIGGRRSFKGRKSAQSPISSGGSSSFSNSFVVEKSSLDPYKDFRASMMEMIVENNIRANRDLEELLACYLSLNSDEYHDIIIRVFKQIWFEFVSSRSK